MDTRRHTPLLLSIDDEAGTRDVVAGIAELAGFSTAGTAGGRELFAYLELKPEVIVLDLTMPDMDGIEVLWELSRRKSPARIVILSGFQPAIIEAAQRIALALNLDLVACLPKPVVFEDFLDLLESLYAALGSARHATPPLADDSAVIDNPGSRSA